MQHGGCQSPTKPWEREEPAPPLPGPPPSPRGQQDRDKGTAPSINPRMARWMRQRSGDLLVLVIDDLLRSQLLASICLLGRISSGEKKKRLKKLKKFAGPKGQPEPFCKTPHTPWEWVSPDVSLLASKHHIWEQNLRWTKRRTPTQQPLCPVLHCALRSALQDG